MLVLPPISPSLTRVFFCFFGFAPPSRPPPLHHRPSTANSSTGSSNASTARSRAKRATSSACSTFSGLRSSRTIRSSNCASIFAMKNCSSTSTSTRSSSLMHRGTRRPNSPTSRFSRRPRSTRRSTTWMTPRDHIWKSLRADGGGDGENLQARPAQLRL